MNRLYTNVAQPQLSFSYVLAINDIGIELVIYNKGYAICLYYAFIVVQLLLQFMDTSCDVYVSLNRLLKKEATISELRRPDAHTTAL